MKTYTEEEVIELLVKERTRARDIAYSFKNKNEKKFEEKKQWYGMAFMFEDIANECRLVGNVISGVNALTPEEETIQHRIKETYFNER